MLATSLLCSTGSMTNGSLPTLTQYKSVLEYGPQLANTVDGFEVMFYGGWYEQLDHISAALQGTGLCFPAMHTEKQIGLALGSPDPETRAHGAQLLAENCRMGQQIGVKTLILHLWGWPDSDKHLERNLLGLPACL